MQQFYVLEKILSFPLCNNATMQQFYILKRIIQVFRFATMQQCNNFTLNTYRTAVSPTLDLLCHEDFNVGRSEAEDFNVGRSEAESNIEIFMAQ